MWIGSGIWKRLNFYGSGSTLKKEPESGSKLGSIRLFENPEAVKLLWKRKHFEERSWKQTRKHSTFSESGSGSIFHKTWGRDVEEKAVKIFVEAEALWRKKLETEANSEAFNFLRIRKRLNYCGSGSTFEERSWKRKQTRKRLTLYGAGSGSKK